MTLKEYKAQKALGTLRTWLCVRGNHLVCLVNNRDAYIVPQDVANQLFRSDLNLITNVIDEWLEGELSNDS